MARRIGLAAAFVLAASGFMIPSSSLPEIHDDFEALDDMPHVGPPDFHLPDFSLPDLHIPSISELTSNDFSMPLSCPGCFVLDPINGASISNVRNYLMLRFAVSEDGKSILVNNHPLYPPSENLPNSITVLQLSSDDDLPSTRGQTTRELYFSGAVTVEAPDESGEKKITILLHPDALENEKIDVGFVKLLVMQSKAGRLYILSMRTERHDFEEGPTCHGPEFLCNMIHFVKEKLAAWSSQIKNSKKPCFLNKGMHGGPPPMNGGVPKFTSPPPPSMDMDDQPGPPKFNNHELDHHVPHHFDDYHNHYDHHDPHAPHRHHDHFPYHDRIHSFAMALRDFLVGFLIPVLIGIMAGLAASLIGMCVGTSVAWLWIKFVRKGRRGPYARVPQHEDGAVVVGEAVFVGDSVKIEEEAPPVYVEKE